MIPLRRRPLLGLALAALGWPTAALPQTGERVYRIGVLRPGHAPPPHVKDLFGTSLPRVMAELGHAPGRNLMIEFRHGLGDAKRLTDLARSFVEDRFDLVIAVGAQAATAMKQATSTLPIVVYGNFDPLALGLLKSLARPGGNLTGLLFAPDGTLAAKRLQLLKEMVPQATRIGLLAPDDDVGFKGQLQETLKAARTLRLELPVATVRGGDYAAAFDTLVRQRVAAVVVGSHQYFVVDRATIIELAARHKMPAMYEWREQVAEGGLMTYSTNIEDVYRRIASYVDRILKGANPAEMPVERPATFDLVINLKTARALGLAVPAALRLQADEVIE